MKNNAVTRVLFIFAAALFALLAYKNLCVLIDGTIPAIAEEMSVNGFLLTLFVVSAAFAGIFCLIIRCRRKPLIHGVPEKKGMKLLSYVLLFVIAYALRVLWITSIKTAQYSDYQIFYWVANTISSGGSGYTADPYFHTWAYQVGFPAFMSPFAGLFPGNESALVYINALFESGTVLCVFHLLRGVFSGKSAFLISLAYLAFPFPYTLTSVFTNQLAAAFFMYLGVCVIFSRISPSWRKYCMGAVCFAIGNVLRPEGILFFSGFVVLLAFCFFEKTGTVQSASHKKTRNSALNRAASVVLVCAVYFCLNMVFSQFFVWTNLNPGGLKNHYPLYKFAIGLNADSMGQYSKEEATHLMDLNSLYDTETRDEITMEIIKEKLSIGPDKLLSLMSEKMDILWTNKNRFFPALATFENNDVVPVMGISVRVLTVKNLLSLVDGLFLMLLFIFCGVTQCRVLRSKEFSPVVLYLTVLFEGTCAVFCLVEVQRRYSYIMLPLLFVLAVFSCADLKTPPRRRRATD